MGRKPGKISWLKLWIDPNLDGGFVYDLNLEVRGMYISLKLLAGRSQDHGWINAEERLWPRLLNVKKEELERNLAELLRKKMVVRGSDGRLRVRFYDKDEPDSKELYEDKRSKGDSSDCSGNTKNEDKSEVSDFGAQEKEKEGEKEKEEKKSSEEKEKPATTLSPVGILMDWHKRVFPNCDARFLRQDYEKLLHCGRWTGEEIQKAIDAVGRENQHGDSKALPVRQWLEGQGRADPDKREVCEQCRGSGWIGVKRTEKNGWMKAIFCSCSNGDRVRKVSGGNGAYKSLGDIPELVQMIANDEVFFTPAGGAMDRKTGDLVEV